MRASRIWIAAALAFPLAADDGLWLYNQFPVDTVKTKYEFDATPAFLENLRLSTVRIGSGSGAFVSPGGLLVTSFRNAAGCRVVDAKCEGLEASVLLSIEEVTARVKEAAKDGAKPAEAVQKRAAAAAQIEKDCAVRTGNSCTVVKLYSGERYDLYRYQKYTDLRLVFAPEPAIALFGGDPDSYIYPRYALDVAFLRAYENGKPAATPHFLKWSTEGAREGDLIFLAGNPGATSRLATQTQLVYARDHVLPLALTRLQTRIELLRNFTPQIAASKELLRNLSNTYKSVAGRYIGLKDDRLMARKQNLDRRLRNSVEHDPKLGAPAGKIWDEVATAYRNWTPFERPFDVLERPGPIGSALLETARRRLRNEPIPAAEPTDEALEIVMLAQYFEELKALGDKESPLKAILGGQTAKQAAGEYVHSPEAMARLAKLLEDPARKLLKKHEDTIESLETSSAARIEQYRLKIFGAREYPDATGTPRVSFGVVKAYKDKTETAVPWATTFGGLFHRAGREAPYALPERWTAGKSHLDLVEPFDFVSTCDIAGGNIGGPTVNARGELVGVAFDANIESLALTYLYSEDQARAVHVAAQGIVEALQKLYDAAPLVKELGVSVNREAVK
jgi:hypothetical protein